MKKELKRILYVEDDADIQLIGKMALELGGFTVITCNDGQEALRISPQAAADLILLDVMMPGLDGPATLKMLRQNPETARIPVIFMTAKAQASEIAKHRELSEADVIVKPFDPMTLAETIRKLWAKL